MDHEEFCCTGATQDNVDGNVKKTVLDKVLQYTTDPTTTSTVWSRNLEMPEVPGG